MNSQKWFAFFVSHSTRSDSTNSNSDNSDDEIPPHCHITIRCTREIAGFNGLGEAVRRLDFRSSVRDRRRFQYVCSLLRLLVSHKGIASLPGSAQRLLLQMLEEVAEHGMISKIALNIAHALDSTQIIIFFQSIDCTTYNYTYSSNSE